jgi:hypothetical protein
MIPDLDAETLASLEEDLASSECAHVYVSEFEGPSLLDEERRYFSNFLKLVKDYDLYKEIMCFQRRHADTSRVFSISAKYLINTSR